MRGAARAARRWFAAHERTMPGVVRNAIYSTGHVARRLAARMPHRGRPVRLAVSAYCVYRERNAERVLTFARGLPAGSVVHLHALDRVAPSLETRTRGRGPGARMPLLQGLIDLNPPGPGQSILVFDDDVSFDRDGLRSFPGLAARAGLDIAQPAHAVGSVKTFRVNAIALFSTARLTRYVEVGPVVFLSPRAQARVLPFPPAARMGWGVDVLWSGLVRDGLRLGVVDATPMLHHGLAGSEYDVSSEYEFLQQALTTVGSRDLDEVARALGPVWRPWQALPPWLEASERR